MYRFHRCKPGNLILILHNSGILNLGGTILGTSREKPFRKLLASGESEKPQIIIQNYEELGLDCLVCIGGNGGRHLISSAVGAARCRALYLLQKIV